METKLLHYYMRVTKDSILDISNRNQIINNESKMGCKINLVYNNHKILSIKHQNMSLFLHYSVDSLSETFQLKP